MPTFRWDPVRPSLLVFALLATLAGPAAAQAPVYVLPWAPAENVGPGDTN